MNENGRGKRCRCGQSSNGQGGGANGGCHGYGGGVQAQGGLVLSAPSVTVIYWDPYFTSTPAAATLMNQYITELLGGTFMNGLQQYGVGRGTLAGSVTIDMTTYPAPATIDENGLKSQLVQWFKDGVLTPPAVNEASRVYFIFAPSATTVYEGTDTGDFCGYHKSYQYNAGSSGDDLFYGVTVQGNYGAATPRAFVDSCSWCVSHELVEASSNPSGQGYVSSTGCEIGDICEADTNNKLITTQWHGWTVERYWSNWDGACVTERPLLGWSFLGNTAGFGHAINDGRPFWIGDFKGAERDSVLFYYPGDDNWWLGTVANGQLQWELVGNTANFGHAINDGRPFWTGNFRGDDPVDVLFYGTPTRLVGA
jgi:hypothetical protein